VVLFKMAMVPEALGDDVDDPDPISEVVTDVDVETARVTYEWQLGDTSVEGVYRQEWHVTFADGTEETFPSEPNSIVIRESL
jgi:hypothetical protein